MQVEIKEASWQHHTAMAQLAARHQIVVDELTGRNVDLERECEEERRRHVMLQANSKREVIFVSLSFRVLCMHFDLDHATNTIVSSPTFFGGNKSTAMAIPVRPSGGYTQYSSL
jgi:hypothetical protein